MNQSHQVSLHVSMKAREGCRLLETHVKTYPNLTEDQHTFEVKEHIRSIIFEHLRNELYIHVLDVDLLAIRYLH